MDNPFVLKLQRLDDDTMARIVTVQAAYAKMFDALQECGLPSAELTLAVRSLQTSCDWAVRSISQNNPNVLP